MATTKATSSTHIRFLILAAILAVVTSIQARGDSMPPPPAMAPSPVAGGQCPLPPNAVAELGVCFESSPLGVIHRPSTLDGLRRCCRRVRAQLSLGSFGLSFVVGFGACMCSAYSNSGPRSLLDMADNVNIMLAACGGPPIPGLACSSSSSSS
ncbi:unnamed protein product [Alopecurus aequalis]